MKIERKYKETIEYKNYHFAIVNAIYVHGRCVAYEFTDKSSNKYWMQVFVSDEQYPLVNDTKLNVGENCVYVHSDKELFDVLKLLYPEWYPIASFGCGNRLFD